MSTKDSEYKLKFGDIVWTEVRCMVVKNQWQRFNRISPSRTEFNIVCFGKTFYFKQNSSSVWTTKLRLGAKFKPCLQKIISYFVTRNARRKDKMKIKLCRIKKPKGNKKILHEIMMNQNELSAVGLLITVIKVKKRQQNYQ